jgi:hypothetical protein
MREGGGVVKSLEAPSTGTGVGSHSEILFPVDGEFLGVEMQLTLFGPMDVPPKNLGGRPRWNKVEQYQEFVEYLVELGAPQSDIARAVGVSIPTLALYFSGGSAWQARWGHPARRNPDRSK